MRGAIVRTVSQRFRAHTARCGVVAAIVATMLACATSLLAQQEDVLPRPPLSLTASVSSGIVALRALGPSIYLEQAPCNGGGSDLTLNIRSQAGNTYDGVCPLGGATCTFRMTRR